MEEDGELMRGIRDVMRYTGLNLAEALKLPCDLFLLCRKNYMVEQLMQTAEGREYLEDCERLKQTRMDRSGLHALMKRMGGK